MGGRAPCQLRGRALGDGGCQLQAVARHAGDRVDAVAHEADDRVPVGRRVVGPGPAVHPLRLATLVVALCERARDGLAVGVLGGVGRLVAVGVALGLAVGDRPGHVPHARPHDDVRDRVGDDDRHAQRPHPRHVDPLERDRQVGQEPRRPAPGGDDDGAGVERVEVGHLGAEPRLHPQRERLGKPCERHPARVHQSAVGLVGRGGDALGAKRRLHLGDLPGVEQARVDAQRPAQLDVRGAGLPVALGHRQHVAGADVARPPVGRQQLDPALRQPHRHLVRVVGPHHAERAPRVSRRRSGLVVQLDPHALPRQRDGQRRAEEPRPDDGDVRPHAGVV